MLKLKIRFIRCVSQLSECRRRLRHRVETSVLNRHGAMSAKTFMNSLGIIEEAVI